MPYKKRICLPDYFYHVTGRGNRRQPIFHCYDDFLAFTHILNQLYEKYPFELASFCVMTNHYHLQIRSHEVPLSKIMSLLNKRYANYHNYRYGLSGHVFEKRYHDSIIVDPIDMLEVSRYIYLNPVKANIVQSPKAYPWSSCYLYENPDCIQVKPLNVNLVLDYYGGTVEENWKAYSRMLVLDEPFVLHDLYINKW